MKLPNEFAAIGRLYPVSSDRTFSMFDVETIIRDCAKQCTLDRTGLDCEIAILARYGLKEK